MHILLLITLLLFPTLARAAYQEPVVIANERQANGLPKLTLEFTGSAGEPVVRREFLVQPSSTATILRNWVDATLNELDLMNTTAKLAALQPQKIIPRLAPVAPTPTARNVWRRKADWYAQTCTVGFVGAIATECGTLKADIEATYQAGFILGE